MTNCVGSWSGTIGWYDVIQSGSRHDDDQKYKPLALVPRKDNNVRNMRLSFQPRQSDEDVADWVVYHARDQGVKQDVVLYRATSKDPMENVGPKQTFYCFNEGILGRSGTDFNELPVIEHGFWDVKEGMRRTVVLVYGADDGDLSKICFLQQKKKYIGQDKFNLAGVESRDVSVMPKKPRIKLDKIRKTWKAKKGGEREEVLMVNIGKYHTLDSSSTGKGAVASLLGSSDDEGDSDILRVALPNGVVLACPLSIWSGKQPSKSFNIVMGYRRKHGQVQIVQYSFGRSKLKTVTASWVDT